MGSNRWQTPDSSGIVRGRQFSINNVLAWLFIHHDRRKPKRPQIIHWVGCPRLLDQSAWPKKRLLTLIQTYTTLEAELWHSRPRADAGDLGLLIGPLFPV